MRKLLFIVLLCIPQLVCAQSDTDNDVKPDPLTRELVGVGWLFSDDLIGDDYDRWQTASLTFSWIYARGWQGKLPSGFGDLFEIRAYTQMISPENLTVPSATDRRYAGVLSLGAYTHFARRNYEYSIGAELVSTGPQNGVGDLQVQFHKLIGSTPPSQAIRNNQIPNGFYPTVVAEVGREFDLGRSVRFRPFGEARAGDETLARIGFDFTFGQVGRSELLLRDKVTGQRYRTMRSGPKGVSAIFGVDAAYVGDSVYFPGSATVIMENQRYRARLGFNWEAKHGNLFYGLTYLSREFESQRQSQVVGSLSFKMSF